ncbi:MAG: hypothetical protein WAT43_03220, partial [Chitinophagales bacterium]
HEEPKASKEHKVPHPYITTLKKFTFHLACLPRKQTINPANPTHIITLAPFALCALSEKNKKLHIARKKHNTSNQKPNPHHPP